MPLGQNVRTIYDLMAKGENYPYGFGFYTARRAEWPEHIVAGIVPLPTLPFKGYLPPAGEVREWSGRAHMKDSSNPSDSLGLG